MQSSVKGFLLGAVAAATYGMNPLFALPVHGAGMDYDSILFFRYLFAIPILGLMLLVRGHDFRITRREAGALLLFGWLMALSSLSLFLSYNYMAAGIASTLLFIYPILVALIMTCCCGERLTLRTVGCIALATGGIALLYKGSDGATLDLTGTLLVFVSSLSYAICLVGINRSTLKEMVTLKATFYMLLFGSLLFGAMLLAKGGVQTPDRWYLWGNLVALGLFPTAISLLCTTAAIHLIGSTPTAILGALEPVTAIFFGITVFGERLTGRDTLGLVLIIGAVTLVVAGGDVTLPLTRLRKLFPRGPHGGWLRRRIFGRPSR